MSIGPINQPPTGPQGPTPSGSQGIPGGEITNIVEALQATVDNVKTVLMELNSPRATDWKRVLSELKALKTTLDQLSQTPGLPQDVVNNLQQSSFNINGAIFQINQWKGTSPTIQQENSVTKAVETGETYLLNAQDEVS